MSIGAGNNRDDADRRQQAADWSARLQSDHAVEADFLSFEQWLSVPGNREAFDRMDAVEADIEEFRDALKQQENVVLFRKQSALSQPVARGLRVGVSAMAAAAAFLFFANPVQKNPSWTNYAASKSESRRIDLSDGSTIDLNRNSEIRVALGPDVRHVEMLDAEASFSVAHDARRPFIIDAGRERVTVIGTEFNILNSSDRTVVTVKKGVVAVAPKSVGEKRAPIRLLPGDQLTRIADGPIAVTRRAGAADAAAWKSGRLVYKDAPLSDVVADLNRYFEKRVRLDSQDVETMRFSGILVVDSEDKMISRLEAFLPLEVSRKDNEILIRHRRP